jgi:hypothetical protein
MRITLVLEVEPEDTDEAHTTGLTEDANDRLMAAIGEAGFGIVDGPRVKVWG